jgi:hypothetical protein
MDMKRLLKYLLPLMVAIAFWNSEGKELSTVAEKPVADMSVDASAHNAVFAIPAAEVFLPRTVSFSNAHRIQTGARRTSSAQRSSIEFAKSGKVMNAGLRYFIQNRYIIIRSSLSEPARILLFLGKLII